MLSTIATVLAGLIGALVVLMGAYGMLAPRWAAGFGIPGTPVADPAFQAWLRVKAGRDIGTGAMILVVVIGGTPYLLGAVMLAATLMPIVDALIVLRSGGPKAAAYGMHGATAATMAVIATLLLTT